MAIPSFSPRNQWRQFDGVLLVTVFLLLGLGLLVLYSASRPLATLAEDTAWFHHPVARQALYASAGILLMFVLAAMDYRVFGAWAPWFYLGSLGLLTLVLFVGEQTYGARRWLDVAILSIQPSELAKFVLIIVQAKFLADRAERLGNLWVLVGSLALLAPMVALVYLQPNLGTAFLLLAIWGGIAFFAGIPFLYLLLLALIGLGIAPFAAQRLLHGYMWERLTAFLNPQADPLGAGYNILQAEISVGSGGLFGKGFLEGTQSQLHFLRVQRTDFIFSVLGEELGFIGAMVLLSLFALLLVRTLRVTAVTADPFGRNIAAGVAFMVLVQTFINISGNIRLLPLTGVPLPLVSYGGSSLIVVLASIGILQSILVHPPRPTARR